MNQPREGEEALGKLSGLGVFLGHVTRWCGEICLLPLLFQSHVLGIICSILGQTQFAL